jgi:hypothetical protein
MPQILFKDYGDANGDIVMMLAYKLFINGVDVTNHITGSLTWTYGDRDATNTLTFNLDNNNDKFVLKPQNIGLSFGENDSQSFADAHSYATSKPWEVTTMKEGDKPSFIGTRAGSSSGFYDESAKQELLMKKLRRRVKFPDDRPYLRAHLNPETGKFSTNALDLPDISLYEGMFTTHAPVINVMDQVILWVMDPNRDAVFAHESLWIPVFTGFVMSAPPENSYDNGQSSINVTCEDIRTLLKRKRVLTNTASAGTWLPNITLDSGLFADATAPASNITQNSLADSSLNFEGVISLLLAGLKLTDSNASMKDYCLNRDGSNYSEWMDKKKKNQDTVTVDGEELPKPNNMGFGSLWFGHYFTYDTSMVANTSTDSGNPNSERSKFFNDWNRVCVFGSRVVNKGIVNDYFDYDTMMSVGKGTYAGGKYDALAKLFHILVPTGGGKVTNLLDKVFLSDFGAEREYQNVGELLQTVCERIDYQVTVTGFGDIVFEFPMYDFTAADMGDEFRAVYAVSDSVKTDAIDDEASSNPVTGLRVIGGYQTAESAEVDSTLQSLQYTVYVYHTFLSYRYGYNQEDYPVPFLTSGVGAVGREDKEKTRLLCLFGVLEFLKRLTEMSSMQISSVFNPFIRPNRPYYYNYGRRLSTTTTVSNTLALFTNADTSVTSKYVRRVHDTTGSFIAFSGSVDLPLRYSDAGSLNNFFDDNQFKVLVNNLFKAGIVIEVPVGSSEAQNAGVTSSTSTHVSLKKGVGAQVCGWDEEAKAQFNRIAKKQGVSQEDLLRIIAFESGADTHAVNDYRGNDGQSRPTYAVGFNQMLPISIIDTLENSPALLEKYSKASDLLNAKFKASYRKGGSVRYYVPDTMKQEFVNTYLSVFNTPASQLEMFDAYLDRCKTISGVPQSAPMESFGRLVMAQIAPTQLKKKVYTLSASEQAVNPGITTTDDYAAKSKANLSDAQLQAYLNIINSSGNGCGQTTPASTAPQQSAPVLGGSGVKSSLSNMYGLGSPYSPMAYQAALMAGAPPDLLRPPVSLKNSTSNGVR